jgi:tRNA/rRNA methyltransferase
MCAEPAPPPPDPTRFVLVGTSHAGNVGAAARAMKVMGFSELVLVEPRFPDVLVQEETVAMASGAADVLVRARVVGTLDEALEGVHWAAATAMTPRDFGPPTGAPRELLPGRAAVRQKVAFVFGSERYGLANEDVYRCHACLSIPTAPAYGSLNLAQAVQLVAYEWRQALGGFAVVERVPDAARATADEVRGLLEHWRQVMTEVGFLDPAVPRRLMARLRRLMNRAELTREEVQILRGLARSVRRHHR